MSRSLSVMNDGSQALGIPSHVALVALTTTAQEVPIPGDITHLFFSRSSNNFVVGYGSTASLTTSSSGGNEINPSVRYVPRGSVSVLSLIASTAGGHVSVSMFNSGSTTT